MLSFFILRCTGRVSGQVASIVHWSARTVDGFKIRKSMRRYYKGRASTDGPFLLVGEQAHP